MLSYALYGSTIAIFGAHVTEEGLVFPFPRSVGFFDSLADLHAALNFAEIFFVSIFAVVVGILLSIVLNHYWLHDVARFLKITRRFGQPGVWSFAFEMKEVRWATLRDLKNNLMFQGYIRAYSDLEETKEIFLTHVNVYDEATGQQLYKADMMYLARHRDDVTVEFPIL